MTIAALTLLALLFLKHFVWDFCCQTPEMLRGKGIYGNKDGIFHSYLQAIFTWAAVFAVYVIFPTAIPVLFPLLIIVTVLDFVVHYHVDYVKAKYGAKDSAKPVFWKHLGLDQLAHYMTYLAIVAIVFL
jgi:hypothetical protein